jgi:phosphoribosylformylglycinamidine cyclo-ligase
LWPRPVIFDWLRERGQVEDSEMHRVFNCGIGYVLVVAAGDAAEAAEAFAAQGETCWPVGTIRSRNESEPGCIVS